MINIIKNSEIDKNTRYKFYDSRCASCTETNNINILEIRPDGLNSGTIISICDSCLNKLKNKIENLEVENE